MHGTTHFLQETFEQIKDYLSDKPFQVTDWPDNSPDLNPIENCRSHKNGKLKDKDIGSVRKLIRCFNQSCLARR
jgi:hypothetical protein